MSFGSVAARGMRHYNKAHCMKRDGKPIKQGFLYCDSWLCGAHRPSPIDPLEQHRQLCRAQRHRAMGCLRPHEATALQALRKQTQPIPAPPQNLHPITAAAAKDKELPGERILCKLHLHESRQTIEPLAHVGAAGGQPHLYACRQRNHPRTSSATTCLRAPRSTGPWTRMQAPLGNSISMHPGRQRRSVPAGCRRGCSVGNTVGVVTFTGSISATSPAAFSPSNPCRYSCRQLNTWFAFTWWRRATVATEAPRTCVSSTIRRFCSRVCLCRGPVRRPKASVATASAQVSIWAPRGHLATCPPRPTSFTARPAHARRPSAGAYCSSTLRPVSMRRCAWVALKLLLRHGIRLGADSTGRSNPRIVRPLGTSSGSTIKAAGRR